MEKISYSIKVSEEGRPTTLDTRHEEFKPLVDKYERRNIWNSCILIFKNLRSKLLDHLLLGGEHTKKVSPGFSIAPRTSSTHERYDLPNLRPATRTRKRFSLE